MRRLWRRLWGRFRFVLWRAGRDLSELADRGAVALAERTFKAGTDIAHLPWRSEVNPIPPRRQIGDVTMDVVGDLQAYTGIPLPELERELVRRHDINFRAEWHASPEYLRADHWYYLTSKGYLFANATHFVDSSFVDTYVRPNVPEGGRILEFGGGAGNLALMMAAAGYEVWFSELSALQRDFVRFRVARHGLAERVHVLDWWEEVDGGSVDAVVSVDVFEHVDTLRSILDSVLLPAMGSSGLLIENTSFVINTSNPMHHTDWGLDEHLGVRGLSLVSESEDRTRVWRSTAVVQS
jgi:hypothetical protein